MQNKLTELLTFAMFVLLVSVPGDGLGHHREGHGGGGGDSGGGGGHSDVSHCQIGFDVTFSVTGDEIGEGTDKVGSDGETCPGSADSQADYCNGFESVGAGTGSGDGFRFDTDNSNKLNGKKGFRELCIDFDGVTGIADNECFGVDMRFAGDPNNNGVRLDLCSLSNVGEAGEVGLSITFVDPQDGQVRSLTYVDQCWDQEGKLNDLSDSEKVRVTRTKQFLPDGTDEWTITPLGFACLRDGYSLGDHDTFLRDVDAPFVMTITAQDPLEQ